MMADAVVFYLANAVWRIPLVAVATAILVRVGALGPEGRHKAWLAALALAVILPAAPGANLIHFNPPPATVAAPTSVKPAEPLMAPMPAAKSQPRETTQTVPSITLDGGVARAIALVFAAVAAVGLARLAVSWRAAIGLARRGEAVDLAPSVAAALEAMARARGVATPRVRRSNEVRGPVVVGAVNPVILAPSAFFRAPQEEQGAALLHELAHVARRDFAVNLICELAATPACWHPVIYEIKAGVRRSREIACDAMASAQIGSRETYARRLLSLARSFGPREEADAVLVGLIGKGGLEERLMHLIAHKDEAGAGRLRLLAAAAMAAALLAPTLVLRVTPAFAETPVAPAIPIVPIAAPAPESVMPAVKATIATPAQAAASVSTSRPRIARRMKVAREDIIEASYVTDQETPPEPPAPPNPPAPPAPPPAMGAMAAPPAPPPPPPVYAEHVRAMVERALAQSEAALVRADEQSARAETLGRRAEMSAEDRAKVAAELRESMEAWKAQHLPEIMAEVRRQVHEALASEDVRKAMDSEEVRRAVREALREADRALSEQGQQAPAH